MTDKEQIEQTLSYYFLTDESITPEMRQASQTMRQTMSSSLDGLAWFLRMMPFQLPTTYHSAFECFKYRLAHNPEEITQEIMNELHQFLFFKSLQILQNLPPETITELANAQMYLSILIFPQPCGDMFQTVLEMFPDILKYKFLSSFCNNLILPTPTNINQIKLIKQTLNQQNLIPRILQSIQEGIQNKNPDAIYAFGYLSRWAHDVSYLNNADLMNTIFSDTSAELAPSILKLMTSIAQRNMPNDFKLSLIGSYNFPQRIHDYCAAFANDAQIVKASGEAVSILGLSLSGTPFEQPILELAFAFLQHQSEEISDTVTSYIQSAVRSNPAICSDVAQKVVQRIMIQFSNFPISRITPYFNQLFLIFHSCFTVSSETALGVFHAVGSAEGLLNDTNRLSAFLLLANLMLQNRMPIPDFDKYFVVLRPLLNVQPPISPQQFFPVYGFLRTFLYRGMQDNIANQYHRDVLNQMKLFALGDGIPVEMKQLFSKMLVEYISKKSRQCRISLNDVLFYMDQRTPELMTAASRVINSIQANEKTQVSLQCLSKLMEIVQENNSRESVQLALSFLSTFESSDSQVANAVLQIVTSITQACSQDDQLLGDLIKTSIGMKEIGLQFFAQTLLPLLNGAYSIGAAADVTSRFLEYFQNDQNTTASLYQLAVRLIDPFISTVSSTFSIPMNSNSINIILTMQMKCYALFSQSYTYISNIADVITKLIGFTKILMIKRSNNPSVLSQIFLFLETASQVNTQYFVEEFGGPSLYFLLAPNFDPNRKNWDNMLMNLIRFHTNLGRRDYSHFSAAISSVFALFGLSPEATQRYLIAFERDVRETHTIIKKIFVDALTSRNALTWE
ncbi:hypothetical protein TRFO_08310 [Tritrichomonas foetus]|uniref:Uncharacterized protein n=1 Tax=Tritrichomonas foetus TaxID=1144522 RepID=A0A1J4JKQ8_9EUKA|nr:hypothetical protein TRFO_08310 [Tritrichomonas foetus]|eukprot:OHS99674.1 hypothetical protein TRFO_08310 [Tritrichomonas foetus]